METITIDCEYCFRRSYIEFEEEPDGPIYCPCCGSPIDDEHEDLDFNV